MPAAARKGDSGVVHCSKHNVQGASSDVFINNLGAARKGDKNTPHKKPGKKCPMHSAAISGGSSTVFINNRNAARVGDSYAECTKIAKGSNNVFIG